MENMITTHGLTKIFQGKEVVSNADMTIKKGEIYGFLGPNGAGKTTIMNMLMNLVKPTSGEIKIFDQTITSSSYSYLKHIGSMIEYPIFYEKLTAAENLELHCAYMGFHQINDIFNVLKMVHLQNIENKRVKDFSLGMKQRLGIARAIITKPKLLILDEPINGLDPVGIKEVRDLLILLNRDYGITMVISSHILREIEQVADTIGVINDGQLTTEVSMDRIQAHHKAYIEIETSEQKKACFILENKLHLTNFKVINENVIRIFDTDTSIAHISKTLILNDVSIESLNQKQTSLEQYFMEHI